MLWQFIDELQIALDKNHVAIRLVNVVSECGTKHVPELRSELKLATLATDLTMMILTYEYTQSIWCETEMMDRAYSSCQNCPSRRLFPVAWKSYPGDELWSRKIDGWGVNLQELIKENVLDLVEKDLSNSQNRPIEWQLAINMTTEALIKFHTEINRTCVHISCPKNVPENILAPRRLD
ncbi:hypothetical protein ACO0LG_04535 [Undibacterium sp. Ji42W]|uniref:hypothetical protein n=1 Tax=Undibacterium sp. Ji42W TaxID=3413039 RepID=UPI003BEF5AB2